MYGEGHADGSGLSLRALQSRMDPARRGQGASGLPQSEMSQPVLEHAEEIAKKAHQVNPLDGKLIR
jgi:hypothetical protein